MIFSPENLYQKVSDRESEATELEKWKAPTFEQLKTQQNSFRDNRADILGFLKVLLMERMGSDKVFASEAKAYFQSLLLSDHATFLYCDDLSAIKEDMYKNPRQTRMNSLELERGKLAFQEYRLIPKCSSKDQDADGFFPTPKFATERSGTFLTNAYRCAENANGKLMKLEDLNYRVNFACSDDVSNIRILMDLFELLRANPVLASNGFRMKTLGNHRTDSIIIYCGEKGVSAALEEAVNYCTKEGLDLSEQGVPMGVRPLDKNGYKMRRISVTSSPHGGYTFNDLQAEALLESFKVVVNNYLYNKFGSKCDFNSAKPEQLNNLLPEIKDRKTYLLTEVEKEYEKIMKKLCNSDSINMHNLAFPFVKEN